MSNGSGNVSNVGVLGGAGGPISSANTLTPSVFNIPVADLLKASTAIGTLDTGFFCIYAGGWNGVNTTAVHPFYKNGRKYQVPAGHTFRVFQYAVILQGTTPTGIQLMSDTASFTYGASVGSLTAPVYQGGASAQYMLTNGMSISGGTVAGNIMYDFDASSWPGFQPAASGGMMIYLLGKEI